MIEDEITTIIEPCKGVVKPKEEQLIIFTITFYKGGNLEELYICNVQGMDLPLGLLIKSIIEVNFSRGIRNEHHLRII